MSWKEVSVFLSNPSEALLDRLERIGVEWESQYDGVEARVFPEWVPTQEAVSEDTVLREIEGIVVCVIPRMKDWEPGIIVYVNGDCSRCAEVYEKDFSFHPIRLGDDFGYQEFYYEDELDD